ncbi:MAG: hypothetical protein EOL92_00520 [Bacteroidia bacterium]|nr:hypothetical protein [Bacteroidia bacterium]
MFNNHDTDEDRKLSYQFVRSVRACKNAVMMLRFIDDPSTLSEIDRIQVIDDLMTPSEQRKCALLLNDITRAEKESLAPSEQEGRISPALMQSNEVYIAYIDSLLEKYRITACSREVLVRHGITILSRIAAAHEALYCRLNGETIDTPLEWMGYEDDEEDDNIK